MAAMGPHESSDVSEAKEHVIKAKDHLKKADLVLDHEGEEPKIAYAHSMAAIGHLLAAVITGDEED